MSEHEPKRQACDDRMGDMSCTLLKGHRGRHIDERVFGEVKPSYADLAARLADAEARAEAAVVLPDDEALAELLSWTTGDFTRWMPTAHPDHNRWSWRGEGHGDTMRQHYRDAARRLREALRGDQ